MKDEGVVVRLWDFSETSQTAWVFTRGHGLVRALAKGSRRPHARFSGGLDLLTFGEAIAIIKPGAELAQLIEWDLREVFWAVRRRLEAHHAGMYLADLVGHVIHDHDPHPALFGALVDGLRRLERAASDDPEMLRRSALEAALRFQWAALAETGYRPELRTDVLTGRALAAARSYGFAATGGGLVEDPGPSGDAPASRGSGASGGEVWRVRSETVEALRETERQWDEGGEGPLGSEESVERAARLLGRRLCVVLGREPGSHRLLFASGGRNEQRPMNGG